MTWLHIVLSAVAIAMLAALVPERHARTRPDVDVAAVAEQIGLTPEVLLASGITPADGSAIAVRLYDAETERGQLWAAHQSLGAATDLWASADTQLAVDPANSALRQQAQGAAAQVRSARQGVRAAKTALFAVATQGMTSEAVAVLRACRSASGRHVPPSFLAATCAPGAWDSIEAAVLAEQRAQQRGESVPEVAATLLSQIRAQAAVAQANQALSTQLVAMRAAFQP